MLVNVNIDWVHLANFELTIYSVCIICCSSALHAVFSAVYTRLIQFCAQFLLYFNYIIININHFGLKIYDIINLVDDHLPIFTYVEHIIVCSNSLLRYFFRNKCIG